MDLFVGLFLGAIGLFEAIPIDARVLDQCGIAQELDAQGFARELLPDWVCLVQSESSGNTSAIGGPNSNGSYDYGLFQFNDRWWCAHGQPGKDCNVECNDLLTDDITASATCAQFIYNRGGFQPWHGWQKKCEGKPLPNVDHCFQTDANKITQQ